jgi:hypothetical protein
MVLGRVASGILGVVAVALGTMLAAPFVMLLVTPLVAVARAVG